MKIIGAILATIGIAVLVIGLGYELWIIGKKINYQLSYKQMVQTEIRNMVKQEALK